MMVDALLRFPFLWPCRWLLPVVRRGGDGLGLLTHERGVTRPVVYLGNLMDVHRPDDLRALPTRVYTSLEALSEEWKID